MSWDREEARDARENVALLGSTAAAAVCSRRVKLRTCERSTSTFFETVWRTGVETIEFRSQNLAHERSDALIRRAEPTRESHGGGGELVRPARSFLKVSRKLEE
eukprot:Amastigsp_a852697_29.p1 type:complete len:104 gc:universal Amastigsp_a852697_29:326-15(-)